MLNDKKTLKELIKALDRMVSEERGEVIFREPFTGDWVPVISQRQEEVC